MSSDVQIKDTNQGVNIIIKGDVKKDEIEQLTQSCSDGVCDCSPDMLSKISNIKTSGEDGNVTIKLESMELGLDEVSACMSGCECGF